MVMAGSTPTREDGGWRSLRQPAVDDGAARTGDKQEAKFSDRNPGAPMRNSPVSEYPMRRPFTASLFSAGDSGSSSVRALLMVPMTSLYFSSKARYRASLRDLSLVARALNASRARPIEIHLSRREACEGLLHRPSRRHPCHLPAARRRSRRTAVSPFFCRQEKISIAASTNSSSLVRIFRCLLCSPHHHLISSPIPLSPCLLVSSSPRQSSGLCRVSTGA